MGDVMKSKVRIKYLVLLACQLAGGWLFESASPDRPGLLQMAGWTLLMLATLCIFAMKCEKCGKSMFSELKMFDRENMTLNPIKGFARASDKFHEQWSSGVWFFPFKKRCPFCEMERY